MKQERTKGIRPLHWSASGHCWFGGTDEVSLVISERTYEQRFNSKGT